MKYFNLRNRNKNYTKSESFKDAKKIYVFCEGEKREVDYFNYFKERTSKLEIIPIPNERGQSDPVKLKERAESMPKLRSKKLRKIKMKFDLLLIPTNEMKKAIE